MSQSKSENKLDILFSSMPKEKSEKWKQELVNSENGDSMVQMFDEQSESSLANKEAMANDWCKRYAALIDKPIEHEYVQSLVGEAYISSLKAILEINPQLVSRFTDSDGYKSFMDMSKANTVLQEMYEHYAVGLTAHYFAATAHFCEHELKHNHKAWSAKIA